MMGSPAGRTFSFGGSIKRSYVVLVHRLKNSYCRYFKTSIFIGQLKQEVGSPGDGIDGRWRLICGDPILNVDVFSDGVAPAQVWHPVKFMGNIFTFRLLDGFYS